MPLQGAPQKRAAKPQGFALRLSFRSQREDVSRQGASPYPAGITPSGDTNQDSSYFSEAEIIVTTSCWRSQQGGVTLAQILKGLYVL